VGRLSEVKCHDVLLRTFARLERQLPGAHLLLVGDGPLRTDLAQLAQRLGVAGQVRFAGYQAQPERFLQVMNVFALTSRSEGMPRAVLEAWAAGVPVVASRVGGLPELIADGQTGLLFPPGDENALARALLAILGNPSLAQRLTQAGSYRVHSQ